MAKSLSVGELEGLSAAARGMFAWAPRAVIALERAGREAGGRKHEEIDEGNEKPDAKILSKDALDWFCHLSAQPFLQTTRRDKALGYSGDRAVKARTELEESGYVKRHEVLTGKRGGQLAVYEITDAGYELLRKMQVAAHLPKGKGGWLHKFWQHKIAEWAKEKYEGARVGIEDAGSGKSVDVAVYMPRPHDGKTTAVAFEVLVEGEKKETTNVVKDIEAGFDEVIVCVERIEILERLRQRFRDELPAEMVKKVKFQLLGQFLP